MWPACLSSLLLTPQLRDAKDRQTELGEKIVFTRGLYSILGIIV